MLVLIVDDSPEMRDLLERAIDGSAPGKHQIVHAEDGVEALKVVLGQRPDCVVCDWYMPSMSGLGLLRAVHANGSSARFLILTAADSPVARDSALEAGATAVIRKPLTSEKFAAAIKDKRQPT